MSYPSLTPRLALFALLLAPLAHAEPIQIAWNDCDGGPLSTDRTEFACDRNQGVVMQAVVSFNAPQDMTFAGVSVKLEIRPHAATVPAWWHLESGGCRAGGIGPNLDAIAGLSDYCDNPFANGGTALLSIVRPEVDGVILVEADGARGNQTGSIQAGRQYTAMVFNLYVRRSVSAGGVPACEGCGVDATISVTEVQVAPLNGPMIILRPSGPAPSITYEGRDNPGSSLPVARSTWGGLKALYR